MAPGLLLAGSMRACAVPNLVVLLAACTVPVPPTGGDAERPRLDLGEGVPGDGGDDRGEPGGEQDAGPVDCTGEPDFTSCDAAGGSFAICVAGSCIKLAACDGPCPGPRHPIADTNQRECYGPTEGFDDRIVCPDTPGGPDCGSTDFCGEDAQYGWDTTHDAAARFTATSPGGDRVVTDEITGLVWQGCVAGQYGDSCVGPPTLSNWYDAVAYCQASTWGGYSDWILPDTFALQSLADLGRTSPAIDLSAFPNAPSRYAEDQEQWSIECSWSSTSYAPDESIAWVMMTNNGDLLEGSGIPYHANDKAASGWPGCYTRCVRDDSSSAIAARFARAEPVAGEPVVADAVTRLVWQGCADGQTGRDCEGVAAMHDWRSSLAACERLNWAGWDDWRLPNIKELHGIASLDRAFPAIDTSAFPLTPYWGGGSTEPNTGTFWSSTARTFSDYALYAEFGTGFAHFFRQAEGRHVRCVRG